MRALNSEVFAVPSSKNILVVEDDAIIRLEIIDTLTTAGFTVIPVASADEALEVLSSSVWLDLVLTDVRMPGHLDGLDLARQIRERWPDIKIVIGSGEVAPGLDVADAFFPKPYDVPAMLASINQLLGIQKARPCNLMRSAAGSSDC